MKFLYSSYQLPLVIITCLAPYFFSSSACSSFLTTLRRGMPRVWHLLLSILPRADAAAVWMIPFLSFVELNMWVIPITVKGLTIPEAAEGRSTSLSISNAIAVLGSRATYWHQVPPGLMKHTLLSFHPSTFSPLTLTTLPTPSRPAGAGRGILKYPP
jgi:hypothetical protein